MPARRPRQPARPEPGAVDHYQRLGVERDATPTAIKRAYRDLARRLHPDVNRKPDAAARFAEVQAAYEVLSDPAQRRAYNQRLDEADGVPAGGSPEGHYTWTNVAAPANGRHVLDDDEFEDIWQTFFAARAPEPATPASGRSARKRRKA